MPAARRHLFTAMGVALFAIVGPAIAFPAGYRAWRSYPPVIVIGPGPIPPWAPITPWATRVYDFRGLDPLPINPGAYRPAYTSSWPGSTAGAYRAPVESPRPAPPEPVVSPPAVSEGPEIVPAPAPILSPPRSGPREF